MSAIFLKESDVKKCLQWDELVAKMEAALSEVSSGNKVPSRMIMPVAGREGALYAMVAHSSSNSALACKIVTSFSGNSKRGLPSVFATVLLLDEETGCPKAIMEGNTITAWRTAAASVVATKHFHKGQKETLCILGAGTQAKSHILAMNDQFKFSKIKIWNRTYSKATQLSKETGLDQICEPFESAEEAVKGADVICTTTRSPVPILKSEWVKSGAHVNVVGVNSGNETEIPMSLYRRGVVVVDTMDGATSELKMILDKGVTLWGEIGEIINNQRQPPNSDVTIFHSLGMAMEDALCAQLVFEKYQTLNSP